MGRGYLNASAEVEKVVVEAGRAIVAGWGQGKRSVIKAAVVGIGALAEENAWLGQEKRP